MAGEPLCPTCGQPLYAAERRVREALRSALMEQEMTQAELAARLGVTQKHISQVLSGKTGLSFDFAERVGSVLGVMLNVEVRPAISSSKEPES